jgi:hypothetical protein
MLPRLRGFGQGFVNTFLRNNRVLPPVLALLALFVFAWIVAGVYVDEPEEGRVSNQTNVAQTQDAPGSDPAAPEVENRDVDSYAAYRNKDPFRQLLAPAEGQESTQPAGGTTTGQTTTPAGQTGGNGASPPAGGSPQPGGGRAADTDGDGLPDRSETALGQDPNNPDSDGDGTPDGADDADGDGRPDGRPRGAGGAAGGAGSGANGGGATGRAPASGGGAAGDDGGGGGNATGTGGGGNAGGGRPGGGDDLLDSGGSLNVPYPPR